MTEPNTTTLAVFEHHLGAFAQGIESLMEDYASESTIITPDREYVGLANIRGFFTEFLNGVDAAFWGNFKIHKKYVQGSIAYLVWSSPPTVVLATDTLLVTSGKIKTQTFTPVYS